MHVAAAGWEAVQGVWAAGAAVARAHETAQVAVLSCATMDASTPACGINRASRAYISVPVHNANTCALGTFQNHDM